jgi:heme o synthase
LSSVREQAVASAGVHLQAWSGVWDRLRAAYELGKPNLSALVVVTGLFSYLLAIEGPADWVYVLQLGAGIFLTAAGAAAYNMILEEHVDRRMRRTRSRPTVSGRLSVREASYLALAYLVLGAGLLAQGFGWRPAALAVFTLLLYVLVYTPLKRFGPPAVWVGALPGALPTLIGWTAARGELSWQAWPLFFILVAWQFPHFLSLAYMCREDYARAGFRFIPTSDVRAGRWVVYGAVSVAVAAMLPFVAGQGGLFYLVGATLLSLLFVRRSVRFSRDVKLVNARHVFLGSILYLPLLLGVLAVDRFLLDPW